MSHLSYTVHAHIILYITYSNVSQNALVINKLFTMFSLSIIVIKTLKINCLKLKWPTFIFQVFSLIVFHSLELSTSFSFCSTCAPFLTTFMHPTSLNSLHMQTFPTSSKTIIINILLCLTPHFVIRQQVMPG